MDKVKLKKLFKKLVQEYTGTGASGGNAGDGNNIVSPRVGGIFPDDEQELLDYMYKSIYGGDGGHYKNYVKTGNYNSLNKQGMFELKKYIKKIIKEQAYGSATLTTQGQSISGAPGIWEQEKDEILTSAEEMYGIAAEEHFNKIHLYPGKKPGDMVNYRTDKTYIIVEDDLKTIQYISGHSSPELTDLANSLGLNKIGSGQFAGIDTYEGPHTINTPEDMKSVIDGMVSATSGEAQRQSAFYTRQPGTGGTGIDEDSIRINMEQAPPGGGEEEEKKKPKVKEDPPKHDLEKIGKCKAGCVDLELENLNVQVENIERKLSDISKRRADARPSEIDSLTKEKREFLLQLNSLEDQIEAKEAEKEKLLNPEKEQQKESINKEDMKANIKKLWDDYANSRINSKLTLKEFVEGYKKLEKRKILQEGVMNTFFEYFNQGYTNEEIVQLYAEKGVAVPEQFAAKARNTFEAQTKLNAELEMSERNFKNEASKIVNNPATGLADGSVLDDDKQLASGLFNEQDEAPGAPEEKELSDVSVVLKNISKINTSAELSQVLDRLMSHVAGDNVTNGFMAMKKTLGTTAASNIAKEFGIK